MKTKVTKEQIEKAVVWWADRVAKPTFSALTNEERESPENKGMIFAEFLSNMAVKPVTQKQRKKFMDTLRAILMIENFFGRVWILDVDYGPCMILRDAAEAAEISVNNFPWKTTMWLMDGKVLVRLGYDGKQEEL